MSAPSRTEVVLERLTFVSERGFDDVVQRIYAGIGRPDMAKVMSGLAAAATFDDYRQIIDDAAGPSGLLRFLQLDEEAALAKNPDAEGFRLVRIIAGNPVTMSEMARSVPDAGSYVPVTILAYQASGDVHVCYDTVASAIRPYGDERALKVAENLDQKVVALLNEATS
jgi:hypothetical protein